MEQEEQLLHVGTRSKIGWNNPSCIVIAPGKDFLHQKKEQSTMKLPTPSITPKQTKTSKGQIITIVSSRHNAVKWFLLPWLQFNHDSYGSCAERWTQMQRGNRL